MRLHDAIALAVMASLLATACSRLTFIKPNMKRRGSDQVAPDYNIRPNARGQQRVAAMDRLVLAEQRLRAGQIDQAEIEAKAALKMEPKSVEARTLLGIIEEQRGNAAKAGGYYREAAELAPGRGTALNNYGVWLCSNGRAAESLAWFDRALADPAYPTPAGALANAGSCALQAGQMARVERDLRRALSLDPANAVALAAMAEHEFRAGRYFEARAFSQRRLAAAPASVAVLQLASQIEAKLGDRVAADRYVQQLRTEFPQAPIVPPGEGRQR